MRSRLMAAVGIGILMSLAAFGCQSGEARHEMDGDARTHQESDGKVSKNAIGWHSLKLGMDPADVLWLLDQPSDIRVTMLDTTWFYSDDGAKGPYVVFGTRNMRLERWRKPATGD